MKEFFATNRLSAYIDGQLSDAEMAEVEKSIRENPSVRSEYNRMLHAVELVRNQGPVSVPEGFRERLEARLAVERAPKPRLRWLPAPLRRLPLEAIGLAMAAILVVSVIQRDPASEGESAEEAETVAKEEANTPLSTEERPAVHQNVMGSPDSEAGESAAAEPPLSEASGAERSARQKEAVVRSPESASVSKGKQAQAEAPGMGILPQLQDGSGSTSAAPADETVDWEDQYQEAGGAAALAEMETSLPSVSMGPVRYRLYPKSSEVLWQIQRIAERYGAQLQKSNGASMAPYSMTTEMNYANLKLRMSPQRMESFVTALRELGAMSLVEQEETRLYGGGMMELELEVQFEP